MKRGKKAVIVGFVLAIPAAFVLVLWYLLVGFGDPEPKGEGSYAEADQIEQTLLGVGDGSDGDNLPEGVHRFEGESGFHYFAMGINSHQAGGGGGTMGLKFSDGDIRIFFGHVCGGGPQPLDFGGENKAELLERLRNSWVEYTPSS